MQRWQTHKDIVIITALAPSIEWLTRVVVVTVSPGIFEICKPAAA